MLFLVVCCLEISDILFAVDSVSAIVAQVNDLFLAYTSTVFAMLGLRATFFIIDVLVQIWAGIMAGITYVQITGAAFALMPGQHYHWRHVAFAETAFTFVLCFAVLCIASARNPLPDLFGLAIASCVTAGGYAIGSISGGSLNPAVSFGLDFANTLKGGFFSACIFYTFFELLGAVIAVMAFYATHIEEYEDPFAEMDKVT